MSDPIDVPAVVRNARTGGQGVFAARDIAAGDAIVAMQYLREITSEDPRRPGENPEHCAYVDGRVFFVGPPACFTNHSCDPNAYEAFDGLVCTLTARRAIPRGDEITVDYLINNEGGNSWPCRCGAARCRGETGTSFFHLPESFQREYRPLLAGWFVAKYRDQVRRIGP